MDDVIIGLEIHVQLNRLQSKMFCGCSTAYHNSPPNSHTCPVCLGLPGSLPVINRKAVEYGIKVGLALNCKIEEETFFYRKNYYYPDLPKGFQISQYDYPLATNGHIMILGDDGAERNIRINRAHMEEDPGRLVHAGTIDKAKYTMVDYNRCGMPLLEVVTEPDLCSPKEARVFLDKLKSILDYLDVFDGSLEGSMRIDANISLKGGDRSEVKNISGFKGVEKALSYEITRQKNLQRRNIKVVQETRHFDELRNITVSIRSKVGAHDYRYFPEADLAVLRIASWVPDIRATLPELPDVKRERFVAQYALADDHAKSLTSEIKLANFYEAVAAKPPDAGSGRGLDRRCAQGRAELPRPLHRELPRRAHGRRLCRCWRRARSRGRSGADHTRLCWTRRAARPRRSSKPWAWARRRTMPCKKQCVKQWRRAPQLWPTTGQAVSGL